MRGGKGSEGGREGAEVSGRLGRRHDDDLTQELLRGLEEGRLVVGREWRRQQPQAAHGRGGAQRTEQAAHRSVVPRRRRDLRAVHTHAHTRA